MPLDTAPADILAAAERLAAEGCPDARFALDVAVSPAHGAHRIDLHLRDPAEPWVQAACRLTVDASRIAALHAAFAIDALEIAMPEDVPAQQAAVEAMAAILARLPGADAAPLHAAWARTRARLEACWTASAAAPVNPSAPAVKWSMASSGKPFLSFVLAGPMTRPGARGLFGVQRKAGDRGAPDEALHYDSSSATVGPLDQATVARIGGMTGHEKMELLRGPAPCATARARTAFDARRKASTARARIVPVADPAAIGLIRKQVAGLTILSPGGEGWVNLHDGAVGKCLDVTCDHGPGKAGLEIKSNGRVSLFYSMSAQAEGLSTAAERALAQTILAWDAPLPDWCARPGPDAPFDPAHPALAGLDIPPRHRPLIAALLATLHRKQRNNLVGHARKRAKGAASQSKAAPMLAEAPDGALYRDGQMCYARLYMVVSEGGGTKARRRALRRDGGRDGVHRLPLTSKRLAKLTRVPRSTALREVMDGPLGNDVRDVTEAAFRLSFDLEPGTRNPFLDREARIEFLDGGDLPTLRVTRIAEEGGPGLLAFAVVFPEDRKDVTRKPRAGAAFTVETVAGKRRFHLRPAVEAVRQGRYTYAAATLDVMTLPAMHRAAIEAGIRHACPSDAEAAPILKALSREWVKLAKKHGEA